MLRLDKIKTNARREAWKPDSLNPFSRKPCRKRTLPDEEGATRVATESDMQPGIESRRQSQRLEYNIPHPNTMPSSSGNPSTRFDVNPGKEKDAAVDGERYDKSEDSGNGTSDTVGTSAVSDDAPSDTKPRRRRTGILGVLSKKEKPKRPGLEDKRRTSSQFFKKDTQRYTFSSQIRATLFNSWINLLLVFVPVGIAVHYANITPVGDFVINFIAIIPLAAMLSYATEEIALRVGETFGGLLNATFG